MSEQTDSTTVTEEANSQQQEQAKGFEAITSQEDFDKAIQARIARERAKFADYDELKTAKTELDTIRESQKTEAEKVQERLDAAEKRSAELEVKATRAEVAAAKGVPAELLSGSTKEELEAAADALIKFKGDTRFVAAGEGSHVENLSGSPEDQFAGFLQQQLGK
ncbi:hypothetical protein ACFVU2_21110 [Leifsonia sp. NPDC058194]|uniref:hypothetical protein n=1 Tax=Leifsonia sp. NPDC058194 TaxID=3346374 RepID=UPI0036D8000D